MPERIMPRYPVYVPSKGRAGISTTIPLLIEDGVPFYIAVEEESWSEYAEVYGEERLAVMPQHDEGLHVTRNWIKQHSLDRGDARHWQLDDNIRVYYYRYKGQRLPVRPGIALRACEDLTDQYSNVAISGHQYAMFAPEGAPLPPFVTNAHVYSSTLVNNETGHWWRDKYNDDTDMCLQVLADGWCIIQVNAFLADKLPTMVKAGGNNVEGLYQDPDGRLKMARSLEKRWPGVVTTARRFGRAQHVVFDSWKRFDTPLQKADDPPTPANFQLELKARKEIQSEQLRQMVDEANAT